MSNLTLTKHASIRMQQRGLPELVVDQLLDYGEYISRGGVYTVVFTKKSLKSIRKYGGSDFASLIQKKYQMAYLILSKDQSVVTAGWRHGKNKFRIDNSC